MKTGMARRFFRTLLPCLLLVATASAVSDVQDVLVSVPTPHFTESDRNQLRIILLAALNADGDGTSRHWKNAATGNRGRIKIIETSQDPQRSCRKVRVTNYTETPRGKTSTVITVCRPQHGQWGAPPAP